LGFGVCEAGWSTGLEPPRYLGEKNQGAKKGQNNGLAKDTAKIRAEVIGTKQAGFDALKNDTKSDLLADTLDIRRKCRHIHMFQGKAYMLNEPEENWTRESFPSAAFFGGIPSTAAEIGDKLSSNSR
jgi:hypothetical protein